jgi:hypothetical protein
MKKVISRSFRKKEPVSLEMKYYKAEKIFEDPNRFFKGEMEAAKKSMFFS